MHKALHSFTVINKQTLFPPCWARHKVTEIMRLLSVQYLVQSIPSWPPLTQLLIIPWAWQQTCTCTQLLASNPLLLVFLRALWGDFHPTTPGAGTELSQHPSHPTQHFTRASPQAWAGADTLQPHYWMWNRRECWQWESSSPTCPRNAPDQYCSPLVQHPNRWLWSHSKGALKPLGSTAESRDQQHLE